MRASTQHARIVFALFIAFSILRGYLAFASVKMLPKKKKRKAPVRFRHRNRERKGNRRASLTKNQVRKIGRERQRLILSAREVAAVAESASRSKIQLEEPDEESQFSSSTPIC